MPEGVNASSSDARAWSLARGARAATAFCALVGAPLGATRQLDRLALPEVTYRRSMTAVRVNGGEILARRAIAPEVAEALAYLRGGSTYNATIAALAHDGGRALEIHPVRETTDPASFADATAAGAYDPLAHRVFWNPRQGVREYHVDVGGELVCRRGSPAAVLGHELLHALERRVRPARSAARSAIVDPVFGSAEERAAALATTRANREIGEPPMDNYDCGFAAASGPLERGEPCVAPEADESALLARRLRSSRTTADALREGEAALAELARDFGEPDPGFAALARRARELYLQVGASARGGTSYAAMRPRIDAFMRRALRSTRDYPRVAAAAVATARAGSEARVEFGEAAHGEGREVFQIREKSVVAVT